MRGYQLASESFRYCHLRTEGMEWNQVVDNSIVKKKLHDERYKIREKARYPINQNPKKAGDSRRLRENRSKV